MIINENRTWCTHNGSHVQSSEDFFEMAFLFFSAIIFQLYSLKIEYKFLCSYFTIWQLYILSIKIIGAFVNSQFFISTNVHMRLVFW